MSRTVYVMSAARDWFSARQVQDILRMRGWEILGDWTHDAERAGFTDREHAGELDRATKRDLAEQCVISASTCDLAVLLFGPKFAEGMGFLIETGIVIGRCSTCTSGFNLHVISPPRDSIFFSLDGVTVFEDTATWAATADA